MAKMTLRWANAHPSVRPGKFEGQPDAPYMECQFDPEELNLNISASWDLGDNPGDPREESISYKGTTGRLVNFTLVVNDYGNVVSKDQFRVHWLEKRFFSKIDDNFFSLTNENRNGTITQQTIQWLIESTRPLKYAADEPAIVDIDWKGGLRIRGVITELSYSILMIDPAERAPIRAEINISIQETRSTNPIIATRR